MSRLENARQLVEEINDLLAGAAIDNAHVTLDVREIPSALSTGPALILQPPDLTFPTYTATTAAWELLVVAGPLHDVLQAWASIDPVIEVLQVPLSLDRAQPATYSHPAGQDYPAYILTFTENI